jgi:hypothetical protein
MQPSLAVGAAVGDGRDGLVLRGGGLAQKQGSVADVAGVSTNIDEELLLGADICKKEKAALLSKTPLPKPSQYPPTWAQSKEMLFVFCREGFVRAGFRTHLSTCPGFSCITETNLWKRASPCLGRTFSYASTSPPPLLLPSTVHFFASWASLSL